MARNSTDKHLRSKEKDSHTQSGRDRSLDLKSFSVGFRVLPWPLKGPSRPRFSSCNFVFFVPFVFFFWRRAQGQYAAAEPLFRRSLEIGEKQLGPDHPDVAQSLWWFATILKDKSDYQEAQRYYLRALDIFEKSLRPEHPSTKSLREQYQGMLRAWKKPAQE